MGAKPKRSSQWGKSTIVHILTNPVYLGKIQYKDRATIKKPVNGKLVRIKNDNPEVHFKEGLHEALIDIDTWNKVQDIRKNNLNNRTKVDYSLKNPLSSIIKCGICGYSMHRITAKSRSDIRLYCKHCRKNIGSNIDFVEDKLIEALKNLLNDYKIKIIDKDETDINLLLETNQNQQIKLDNDLNQLNIQLNNLYDLLEQGVYTKELFLERLDILKNKIEEINNEKNSLKEEYNNIIKSKNNKEILIPKIEKVIDTYDTTNNFEFKNKLLKSVLQKVEYTKINPVDKYDFKLKLYPKLR